MTKIPSWRRYLTFWRTPIVQDVDDELRFHTNMRVKEYMARGLSEDEARRIVAERLGDIHAAQSECVELTGGARAQCAQRGILRRLPQRSPLRDSRASRSPRLRRGDHRHAWTRHRRQRRGVLRRRPPALPHRADVARRKPHARTYVLYATPEGDGGHFTIEHVPYVRYKQISETNSSFARTAAFGVDHSVVGTTEDGREMQVAGVTPSFFGFFDAPPRLGRYFNDREDLPPGGEPVAVLSYAMWQTEFGGRDDVLGAKIQIGQTYTVIGVAPRWFAGLWPDEPPVAYIPFAAYAAATSSRGRSDTWWTAKDLEIASMLMTRKPGVSVEMATTDLTHQMRLRWDEHNDTRFRNQPTALLASTLAERGPEQSEIARVGALVGAMALVVLLIAGANVANLLLARALRRRREIAVRLALGISRRRLVSQLLTETLLLASLGGLTGLLVARWGGPALRARFVTTSVDTSVVTDLRTLMFVGLAVVLAGVATGFAPAWQAGRLDVTRFLRIGAREGTLQRSRLRASLLIVQGALSVLLLTAAGLFVRSLNEARHVHMGYDVDRLLMVHANMRGVRLDSARSQELWRNLATTSRTVPGVERAAVGWAIPLRDIILASVKRPPEMDSLQFAHLPLMLQNTVMPGFFETMGTRILRGRAIDSTDVPGSPLAVVVSYRFAHAFWPGQDALGRCVMNARGVCRYVVGVAEDIRNGWGMRVMSCSCTRPPPRAQFAMDSYLCALMGTLSRTPRSCARCCSVRCRERRM